MSGARRERFTKAFSESLKTCGKEVRLEEVRIAAYETLDFALDTMIKNKFCCR